jgi:GNAT superfamily N-acetyltransferase
VTEADPSGSIRIREIREGESLRGFIDLQWRINQDDPHWVAPLRMSLAGALNRAKHPFHRHAEVAYFVAERKGRIVGRIAAIMNLAHNDFHEESTGFFGLFEAEDDQGIADVLLDTAARWLAERGMDRMRGPVNFSTNEEVSSPGILVDGFDTPPAAMMSHNPPYYEGLLVGAGLEKSKDLTAYWLENRDGPPPRLVRGFERALQREGATIRPLDLKHFRRDVDIIKAIYNSAWSRNWGFVPMTDAEFEHMAKDFRPIVDPALCLIAEVEGKPIGFSLAIPNIHEAMAHIPSGRLFPFGIFKFLWYKRKISSVRVITLGFIPEYQHSGLGAAFYLHTWMSGTSRGYHRAEASWILEDNIEMVRPLEHMGGHVYKRYRIYERMI